MNCNQPNCKNHKTCNLKQPLTPYTLEINYWLKELRKAKQRITAYGIILSDIQHNKYSTPVNVYGNIQYAPKQNVFGVFIRRPEHIHYGWNLNKLNKAHDEIEDKIRTLRLNELREEKQ